MDQILDNLARHGALILFAVIFVEQMGLPVPGIPFLLAAGVLAGAGKLNILLLAAVSTVASSLADTVWFYLGRKRGNSILKLFCKISLEPDTCVRRTEDVFSRFGMKAVLMGKFVPGVGTVAPPLAGIFGVSLPRFLAYDVVASVLYTGCFLLIGFFFSNQLKVVLVTLGQMGHWAVVVIGLALLIYIGWKYFERQRVLRELRIARITVDELRRMQESEEKHLPRGPAVGSGPATGAGGDCRSASFSTEGHRGPAPGDSARSRHRVVLLVPERSHCGADRVAPAPTRDHAGAAVVGRDRCVARAEVSAGSASAARRDRP